MAGRLNTAASSRRREGRSPRPPSERGCERLGAPRRGSAPFGQLAFLVLRGCAAQVGSRPPAGPTLALWHRREPAVGVCSRGLRPHYRRLRAADRPLGCAALGVPERTEAISCSDDGKLLCISTEGAALVVTRYVCSNCMVRNKAYLDFPLYYLGLDSTNCIM